VKNSFITPLPGVSVSKFVVPSSVEAPPVVYLYNSISTAKVPLEFISKCVVQAHNPAGMFVTPGTPLSVANVANSVLVLPAILVVIVCSAPPVAVGLHCLYVGVPKALFVFTD
jgi:hypothetical protein